MNRYRGAGVSHARGGRGGLYASRHATKERAPQLSKEGENTKKAQGNAWSNVIEALQSIKEGLTKEGIEVWAEKIDSVLACAKQATHREGSPQGIESRLEKIEALLRTPPAEQQLRPALPQVATWAQVAASSTRSSSDSLASRLALPTVRVHMDKARGMENEDILKEVKKTIPGAAAIRLLRSGDIDVTVPTEAARDRAMGIPPTEDLKVYRKDYLVEIPGVPLSLRVASEKSADNTQLASSICEASRPVAAGLRITRIRWLHNEVKRAQKARDTGDKRAKTRGSLIVGLSTQEMQRQAIRGGLVINAQIYEARPYERELEITQCFKCQQWGHTQVACGKQARCAQCAGDHDTKVCPKKSVSCVNCGKSHRAWQRQECTTFQAYLSKIQARRVALYSHAASIRSASTSPLTSSNSQESGGSAVPEGQWKTATRKRVRASSPVQEDAQRRLGRPTYLEQAARDPSQQRLGFNQSNGQVSSQSGADNTQVPRTQSFTFEVTPDPPQNE